MAEGWLVHGQSVQNRSSVHEVSVGEKVYYVAPMTLIVPGVLNGSKGALLYPVDEIQKSVDDWNGVPLTLGHPTKDGVPLSAADQKVRDQWAIGWVFNARLQDGKLVADAWFDVEILRKKAPEVLLRLQQGIPLEVSTGLFTEVEYAEGVTQNGEKYIGIARSHVPDHVAVLLDEPGACSIEDGCGVLVNAEAVLNPFPNEHASRQADPSKFVRFRRRNNAFGPGIHVIFGIRPDGKTEVQSIRFDKKRWTVQRAKKWLKDHGFKQNLEEAVGNVYNVAEANGDEEEVQMSEKQSAVKWLVENCSCWTEKEAPVLEQLSEEALNRLKEHVQNVKKMQKQLKKLQKSMEEIQNAKADLVQNLKDEEILQEAKRRGLIAEQKSNKKPSMEEWLQSAPDEVKRAVQNALRIEEEEKQRITSDIVSIFNAEEAESIADHLKQKDLEDLRLLHRVVNAYKRQVEEAKQSQQQDVRRPLYAAAPPPVANSVEEEEDVLTLPSIDWQEFAKN